MKLNIVDHTKSLRIDTCPIILGGVLLYEFGEVTMIKDGYITIQGWMRTELNLKGNDLLVYAIIFGFSQTNDQRFTGSLQYLADWCGSTKQGVSKNLKNLIDKGLIQKIEYEKNGVKFCEYSCMVLNLVSRGMKLSFTNNIDNNIDNKKENISKDMFPTKTSKKSSFELGSKPLVKKPSLYQSCIGVIDSFTQDENLRTALVNYLKFRLEVKEKPLYLNMWRGMVNKLVNYSKQEQLDMIQFSLDRGYLSFYQDNYQGKKQSRKSEPVGGSCEQETEQDKQNRLAFTEEMRKQGKRTEF